MSRGTALTLGLEAFRNRRWSSACSHLLDADAEAPLEAEYLVQLAQAALLVGRESVGHETLARAHQGFVEQQQITFAVRCAFWLGFMALLNGEHAKAGGWLSRAGRLLENGPECVERGYMMIPEAFRCFHSGQLATACTTFRKVAGVARQFGDPDLMTLALNGQGRALIRQGDAAHGMRLLDEAMIAVTSGEVSPLSAGGVYCSVLEGCSEVLDLRRAQEWTSELKKWCDAQPDIVPYRAACLAHRAAVLQWCGEWTDALQEASRACELLGHPIPRSGLHAAYYQVGEIQRLRGNLAEAERAYDQAGQLHADPGPGLAMLWLAKGNPEKGMAVIRRVLEHVREPGPRALVLDAFVEISLATNDLQAARTASDELSEIATRMAFPVLRALSLRAEGQLLLRSGDARGALTRLQQSWTLWGELQVPYESARVRCLIAHTRRDLGDEENALIEMEAARSGFERLGAVLDLGCVNEFLQQRRTRSAGPLTDREVEVLRLVAAGHTNRRIADHLHISEKTVARHLSNIFTKLDLDSRTAATVYAIEHKLL